MQNDRKDSLYESYREVHLENIKNVNKSESKKGIRGMFGKKGVKNRARSKSPMAMKPGVEDGSISLSAS